MFKAEVNITEPLSTRIYGVTSVYIEETGEMIYNQAVGTEKDRVAILDHVPTEAGVYSCKMYDNYEIIQAVDNVGFIDVSFNPSDVGSIEDKASVSVNPIYQFLVTGYGLEAFIEPQNYSKEVDNKLMTQYKEID